MRFPGSRTIKRLSASVNRLGVILMYHRVIDLKYDPWQLAVTPRHFEEHVQVIGKYGQFVKMAAIEKNLRHFSLGQKKVSITFDDGYSDNFHNAKPILEQYETPGTFFIVSGTVDGQKEYWWDELEQVILSVEALPAIFQLVIAGTAYRFQINKEHLSEKEEEYTAPTVVPANDTRVSKMQLYFILWRILSLLSPEEKKVALEQISRWSGQLTTPRPANLPITAEQLISLSKCRLFEIGAHTVSHPMLSRLSVDDQKREVAQSKKDLENSIGRPVTSFSYPHGDYSEDTVKIAKNEGFLASCTVNQRTVMRNSHPHLLPRHVVLDWDGDQFEEKLRNWLTGAS